ncbi:MAG: VWA domain-containing protein [Candidatus Baldrarchaeia archaeon]
MGDGAKNEIRNNLVNVTNKDPVYQAIMNRIAEYLPEDLRTLYHSAPQIPIIASDCYFMHYSVYPMLVEKNDDQILENARKHKEEYMKTENYQNIKTLTTLDDEMSLAYGIKFAKVILEELKKKLEEQMQQQGQQGRQGLQQLLQSASQGNKQAQQQLSHMCQQVLQNMLNQQNQGRTMFQQVLQNAMQQAQKFTENARDVRELLGGRGVSKDPGSFEYVLDLSEKMLHVNDIEEIITFSKRMLDIIPKFTKIAKKETHLKTPIRLGYRKTKKIWRAIPKDLADDEIFEMRYFSNGLRTWQHFSITEGSYYVVIDKSGSMSGEKTVWARSVALALFRLAIKKRRKYFLRFFDTNVHPADRPLEDPKEVLEAILKVDSNGGTYIDHALEVAINDIKERGLSEYTNTVILITDGIDDVKDWTEDLRKNNVKLISIMIDGDNDSLKKASSVYMKATPTEDGAIRLLKVAER